MGRQSLLFPIEGLHQTCKSFKATTVRTGQSLHQKTAQTAQIHTCIQCIHSHSLTHTHTHTHTGYPSAPPDCVCGRRDAVCMPCKQGVEEINSHSHTNTCTKPHTLTHSHSLCSLRISACECVCACVCVCVGV